MTDNSTAGDSDTSLTPKQRRIAQQRKQLGRFLALVLIVVVVFATIFGFQRWSDSRQATDDPQDLRITVTAGSESAEVKPYQACIYGDEDCPEGTPHEISRSSTTSDTKDASIKIQLPSSQSYNAWDVLEVYDDPDANRYRNLSQISGDEFEVPLTQKSDDGSDSSLVMIEIKAIVIGHDSDGNEEPWLVVWSLKAPDAQ